jgi:hypothetical protein
MRTDLSHLPPLEREAEPAHSYRPLRIVRS